MPGKSSGLTQATAAAPSNEHVNEVAPAELNVKCAVVTFVGLAGPASSTDAGAVRSTTQVTEAVPPGLPPSPRACTVTVCEPSADGPGTGHGLVQVVAGAPSREHRCETVETSGLTNEMLADVVLVGVPTGEMVGAPGGTLSTTQRKVAWPGRKVPGFLPLTTKVCDPSARPV